MADNDSRPGGLLPSQRGEYVGFGSAPVQTPRNNSQGDVLSAVTQGFRRLSMVAASGAQSAATVVQASTKDLTTKVQAPETKQLHNMFAGHSASYQPQANQVSRKRTGTVLLVSNLDYEVSNEDIKDIFSEVGDLKRYSLYYDKSGRSKGMAEVVFLRRKAAEAAVKRYNNALLNGKPMKIEKVGTIIATSSVITPTNGTSGYQSGEPRSAELLILHKHINAVAMEEFEKREDCFILDFDPADTLDISELSVAKCTINADSSDISVVAEKGEVACRDFPHSRHSCAKYPFEKTNHERHCTLCYCFVCDIAAPCRKWTGLSGHCHAIYNEDWRSQRQAIQDLQRSLRNDNLL